MRTKMQSTRTPRDPKRFSAAIENGPSSRNCPLALTKYTGQIGKMASPKRCRANQNNSPTSNDSNNPKKQKGENFDFAPTSTSGNKNRKLTQSPARFTAVKNDDNSPTWKDDPRPIKLHGDKSNDEYWLTGYLGFLTKHLLRNLGLSPLVLPWAIEQDLFNSHRKKSASPRT